MGRIRKEFEMKKLLKSLRNLYIQGIIFWLPIAVPVAIIFWAVFSAESRMNGLVNLLIPEKLQFPCIGIVLGVIIISVVSIVLGFLGKHWAAKKVFSIVDYVMTRLPVVKLIYGAVHNLLDCLDPTKERQLGKPVIVYTNKSMNIFWIGFITQNSCTHIAGINNPKIKMVYRPFGLNMGGQVYFVSSDMMKELNMSSSDAFALVFSGGVGDAPKSEDSSESDEGLVAESVIEPDPKILKVPLNEFLKAEGFIAGPLKALGSLGDNVEDLIIFSAKEISNMNHVGDASVQKLEKALAKYGYRLADEEGIKDE